MFIDDIQLKVKRDRLARNIDFLLAEVYFIGEETLYSLRLFTYGYLVFYPRKWSLWHLYGRKALGLDKHWDNFIKDPNLKETYNDLRLKSYTYLRKALQGDPEVGHLFGAAHSIADFENYSGVSFKYKVIHPKHLSGGEPPFETSSD